MGKPWGTCLRACELAAPQDHPEAPMGWEAAWGSSSGTLLLRLGIPMILAMSNLGAVGC